MGPYFRQSIIWAISFIVSTILLSIIGLVVGMSAIVIIKSASVLVLFGLLLMIVFITSQRRTSTDIRRLCGGESWVHWQYPLQIWHASAPTTWFGMSLGRQMANIRSMLLLTAVCAVGIGTLGYVLGRWGGTTREAIAIAIITSAITWIAFVIALYFNYQQQLRPIELEVVDVYIGPIGIFATDVPENLIRLRFPGLTLLDVHVEDEDTPRLQFAAQYNNGSRNSTTSTLSIPIPPDRLSEAHDLTERFRTLGERSERSV